jgi:hypothetical protein
VLVQKILHKKMFIGNDTISEVVNDSDSVVILVNFLTVTPAKYIHPSAAAAAATRKRKLSSQNLTSSARPITESDIPDATKYNLDLLKMSILLLETCRGI